MYVILPIEAMFKIINEAIDVGLCDRHKFNTFLTGIINKSSSFSGSIIETIYIKRIQAQPTSIFSLDPIKKSDKDNNGIIVLNTNIKPDVPN